MGLTRGLEYGNYEVSVNDQPGRPLRGHATAGAVRDWVKIAKQVGDSGHARLRFVCSGRDEGAVGFALGLDYVGWQRIIVEDAIEGENADLTDIKLGRITDQKLGSRFSGGNHLWFHPQKVGASFTWLLDVAEVGRYELAVYFTKSWDYATVRVSLDGKVLGEFDTYAPTVVWAGRTPLGAHDLTAGKHRLTFDVIGSNEKSKGILVGVDCITLLRQ